MPRARAQPTAPILLTKIYSAAPKLAEKVPDPYDKPVVDVYIARQAILDRNKRLFGYELLFRPCNQSYSGVADDSASTLQVLSTTLLSAGLSLLSEHTPAFINFGREMLLTDWTSLFPSRVVVIEILESVQGDPEVVAACMALKKQGYTLAMDDVTEDSDQEFLKMADIIKIDFRGTSPAAQAKLARDLGGPGRRLLAEKIETLSEFEHAKALGFDYFQGFFFSRPVLLQGQQVSAMKGSVLQLLLELKSPDINFKQVEALIKRDVSLTYKLFRYVNSALFSRSKAISAVRDALIAMGELDIRRWIVLATLLDLSSDGSKVLSEHALVRARFCEGLAEAAGLPSSADAFLIGMFSLLDALARRPLPELLGDLGLPAEIVAPLLDEQPNSALAFTLHLARSYELGEWDAVGGLAGRLSLAQDKISGIYLGAVTWAAEMNQLAGGGSKAPGRSGAAGKSTYSGSGCDPDLRALQNALAPKDASIKPLSQQDQTLRSPRR